MQVTQRGVSETAPTCHRVQRETCGSPQSPSPRFSHSCRQSQLLSVLHPEAERTHVTSPDYPKLHSQEKLTRTVNPFLSKTIKSMPKGNSISLPRAPTFPLLSPDPRSSLRERQQPVARMLPHCAGAVPRPRGASCLLVKQVGKRASTCPGAGVQEEEGKRRKE